MGQIVITRYGMRHFVLELPAGRVYILNEDSLRWNLRHVVGMSRDNVKVTMLMLEDETTVAVRVNLNAKAS